MMPTDRMTSEEIEIERQKCLKELVVMANQVHQWKDSYVNMVLDQGEKEGYSGWDFLVDDLSLEILTHVEPYAERFYKCGFLTRAEVWSWLESLEGIKAELREDLDRIAKEAAQREKRRLKKEKSVVCRLKRRLRRWLDEQDNDDAS